MLVKSKTLSGGKIAGGNPELRNRMATWNNGNELDPNGKRWATTMCHAWFVW